ncbi:hemolysin family protein [Peptoniphilus catoniae]|uniref:hemolysin family protein n=1 Tax=Peptoniphilus catoniae TaxID=1660341 RepID=UPI0010FD789C|nr:hemolysin family protein [Peptoniphilus catoniae]
MKALPYIGIIICILLSAFFSGSEIAFASANKLRLKTKADAGHMNSKIALNIMENFNDTLSTILIGNNLVNIVATSISTIIIMDLVGNGGTLIATIVMTVIILIFGEITPKVIAKREADKYVLVAALPLKILKILLLPVVKLVGLIVGGLSKLWEEDSEKITEEDLVTIIENVEDEGVIDKEKSDLLQSALEFSDTIVSTIITPRTDLLAIDLEDSEGEIMDTILNSSYSRIPVYEENIDNIIGILHINRFLEAITDIEDKKNPNLHKLLRSTLIDTCFIHETMKLHKVFKLLNRGEVQMAIVTDEYGGTMGCVTMEDLIEELVGEIYDEYDENELLIRKIKDNTYEVSGEIYTKDLCQELDLDEDIFESNFNTLGGFVIDKCQELPKEGREIKVENIDLKVLKVCVNRVEKVLMTINPTEED